MTSSPSTQRSLSALELLTVAMTQDDANLGATIRDDVEDLPHQDAVNVLLDRIGGLVDLSILIAARVHALTDETAEEILAELGERIVLRGSDDEY
ncbi:hypothetical protein [Gordonia sp. NPDC003376]